MTSLSYACIALLVVLHIVMGSLTEILGIWLVAIWAFRRHEIKA